MRKWLARLSFTFLILAAILGWDTIRELTSEGRGYPQWRLFVQGAMAVICIVLGLAGVRYRHADAGRLEDEPIEEDELPDDPRRDEP